MKRTLLLLCLAASPALAAEPTLEELLPAREACERNHKPPVPVQAPDGRVTVTGIGDYLPGYENCRDIVAAFEKARDNQHQKNIELINGVHSRLPPK